MTMERRIKLKTLNSHITCTICRGYFIDATTVTECLHTFCKSCLVKHLEENNTCPTCSIVIHQSHPLQYISFDRTMQDIVYKLVPDLQHNEMKREREFYRVRGLACPKDALTEAANGTGGRVLNNDQDNPQDNTDYHRRDEQVNVCLECTAPNLKVLKRRFIRCSAQATITHLKKFIAKKVLNGMDKYRDIDILCNNELLGKDHTLKFVYVTRWRFREPPLRLQYRPRIDFVVVFPTYSNYRRFLIHRACEPFKDRGLATFSIGEGDKRRTVLCYAQQIISEFVGSTSGAEAMGVDNKRKEQDSHGSGIYRPPPLRRSAINNNNNITSSSVSPQCTPLSREPVKKEPEKEKETSSNVKIKRPDREVYVPRQRRTISSTTGDSAASPVGAIVPPSTRKQRLSDKSYCNVYTPPHARASRTSNPESVDSSDDTTNDLTNSLVKQSANRKRQLSENGSDCAATPPSSIEHLDYPPNDPEEHMIDLTETTVNNDISMTNNCQDVIEDDENTTTTASDTILWNHSKDEDIEQTELERATQEINRSNRRLIKQSFVSDVLIISEPEVEHRVNNKEAIKLPIDEYRNEREDEIEVGSNHSDEKKEIFNAEEEEWEAMLGEDGECLEPSMLIELTNAVGRVTIQTPRTAPFRPGPDKDPFSHVLEVYNFPAQFTSNDLLSVFSDFKDTGFEIKWVDDSHALAVFSSAKIAEDVLSYNHPMVRTRPLHEATQESRQKAKKCAEYLQPYRTRPETCPALARRLVTGALGVRLPTMSQERIQEKKVLSQFKEKKRMETQMREKLREAAWDGSLGNSNETR